MSLRSSPNLIIIITFLFFLSLISCDQLKEASSTNDISGQKVSFKKTIDSYEDPNCQTDRCTSIEVQSVSIPDNHRVNQIINERIEDIIGYFVSDQVTGIDNISKSFFENYQGFLEAFPESGEPWEINVKAVADWMNQEKGQISVRIETYSYTGGAHPNQDVSFINLSLNGKMLKEMDWLINKEELLKKAEVFFRNEKQLDPMASLNDAGYEFENNQFQLPESVGFEKGNLVLYYNTYEISSYADGPTEIKIPTSKLKGILRE